MTNAPYEQIEDAEYMTATILAEAIGTYCNPETLQAYDESFSGNKPSSKDAKPKLGDLILTQGETLSKIDSFDDHQKQLLAELKEQVTVPIKAGDLMPIGFIVPRASTDKAVTISLEMFTNGNVIWDKSEIEYNGLEFSGVRLLEIDPKIRKNKFYRSGNLADLRKTKLERLDFNNFDPSQYLTEKEAAKYLNISPRSMQALRISGEGPTAVKLGQAVRYKMSELAEWAKK